MTSAAWRERWRADGALFPVRVLTRRAAAAALDGLRAFERASLGRGLSGDARFNTHLLLPFVHDLAVRAAGTPPLRELLGPDVLLWSSDWVVKHAGAPGFYSPHQDSTYMGLSPVEDVVSVWLAVTDSTPDNGCVRFFLGSHRRGQLEHAETADSTNLLTRGQTVRRSELPGTSSVPAALEAGEVSVHSSLAVHESGPNPTALDRVGLVFRFVRPTTKASRPMCAVVVRGCRGGGGVGPRPCWELVEPARRVAAAGVPTAAAWAVHAHAMAKENAVIFDGMASQSHDGEHRAAARL